MNLQNPKKFKLLIDQAHEVALNVLRPISRKYDKAEHAYPKELDMLASLVDGMNEGGESMNAGAAGAGNRSESDNDSAAESVLVRRQKRGGLVSIEIESRSIKR